MGVIIIHKPPASNEAVIDFNIDPTDTERTAWLKANKAAILEKVSAAIDRLPDHGHAHDH